MKQTLASWLEEECTFTVFIGDLDDLLIEQPKANFVSRQVVKCPLVALMTDMLGYPPWRQPPQ